MNSEDPHLRDRAGRAAKIIDAPAHFKICESCESIVSIRVSTCPNCHGYRFDEDPAAVVQQAVLLASRPQRTVIEQDLL